MAKKGRGKGRKVPVLGRLPHDTGIRRGASVVTYQDEDQLVYAWQIPIVVRAFGEAHTFHDLVIGNVLETVLRLLGE